jgi:hypothetical protein
MSLSCWDWVIKTEKTYKGLALSLLPYQEACVEVEQYKESKPEKQRRKWKKFLMDEYYLYYVGSEVKEPH